MKEQTPFDASQHGSCLKLAGGELEFTFQRTVSSSVEQVWHAITNVSERSKWFPGLKIDLHVGGEFSIWFGRQCEGPAHVVGHVEQLEPPTLLQLASMRYQLKAASNGCILTFSDCLPFNSSQHNTELAFAISVLGGWHKHMDSLCASLQGIALDDSRDEPNYESVNFPGRQTLSH